MTEKETQIVQAFADAADRLLEKIAVRKLITSVIIDEYEACENALTEVRDLLPEKP